MTPLCVGWTFLCLILAAGAEDHCLGGDPLSLGNTCYDVGPDLVTFQEARVHCVNQHVGSDLAALPGDQATEEMREQFSSHLALYLKQLARDLPPETWLDPGLADVETENLGVLELPPVSLNGGLVRNARADTNPQEATGHSHSAHPSLGDGSSKTDQLPLLMTASPGDKVENPRHDPESLLTTGKQEDPLLQNQILELGEETDSQPQDQSSQSGQFPGLKETTGRQPRYPGETTEAADLEIPMSLLYGRGVWVGAYRLHQQSPDFTWFLGGDNFTVDPSLTGPDAPRCLFLRPATGLTLFLSNCSARRLPLCQLRVCPFGRCMNGGSCAGGQCHCLTGFAGVRCQHSVQADHPLVGLQREASQSEVTTVTSDEGHRNLFIALLLTVAMGAIFILAVVSKQRLQKLIRNRLMGRAAPPPHPSPAPPQAVVHIDEIDVTGEEEETALTAQ